MTQTRFLPSGPDLPEPGALASIGGAPDSRLQEPGQPFQLHVTELVRTFNRRPVLRNLSFVARPGEVLVVTGPNGVGKSTLLRILAGLLLPTSGRVNWSRGPGPPGAADGRPSLGYLAPDLRPYEELTAAENIDFMGRIRGLGREELRTSERLAAVGLDPARRDPVSALSTGQKQRVKLALALLGEPEALLLDEPGCNLDAAGRRIVFDCLVQARRRGPVIIATNDAEEMEVGDRELRLEPVAGATPGGV